MNEVPAMNTSALDRLISCRSPYIYLNGKTTSRAVNTDDSSEGLKSLSKNDVHCMYLNNIFTLSDLQIARFVAENVYATVPILKKAINYYHNRTRDKDKVALSIQTNYLKERLDSGLCRGQILYKTVFYSAKSNGEETKTKMSYYTCSPHGYNYLKRIVGFDKTYDEYTGVLGIDQVFKYLSSIVICQTFYESDVFKGYEICNQEFTLNNKTGRKFYSPYGKVYLDTPDRPTKYIIEPFSLSFNRLRISEKSYITDVTSRFASIKEYLGRSMVKYDAYVIFTCEDIKGIKAAVELSKKYLPESLDRILFTIDKEADASGIQKSCLKCTGDQTIPVELII